MKLRLVALLSLLALSLVLSTASVTGDVDWQDEVTDPPNDVRDNSGVLAAGREDVDILSVRIKSVDTDLNVTLTLAGPHNSTAEYTVDLLADAATGYHLSWKAAFSASGPSGAGINVMGHVSADGKALSWVIPKSSVSASSTLRVQEVEAKLAVPGALVYTDTAVGTSPDGDDVQVPKSVKVRVLFNELHSRNVTVTVTYEGANASAVRGMMDLDADGTVSPTEASAHADGVRQRIARESSLPNSTLDGKRATQVSYGFELQGAEGSVAGTSPVQFIMMQTLVFPPPEARASHVYFFVTSSAIGGDEPWENSLIGDDPWDDEFIGGDEPWENVFIGGDEPWENEAIGGDEPWENKLEVVFRVEAPEGWRFVTEDWPSGMSGYVTSEGGVLEMDSAAAASSYASTMGKLNTLSFEEVTEDDDGGLPGFASTSVILTLIIAALSMAGWRGRSTSASGR